MGERGLRQRRPRHRHRESENDKDGDSNKDEDSGSDDDDEGDVEADADDEVVSHRRRHTEARNSLSQTTCITTPLRLHTEAESMRTR